MSLAPESTFAAELAREMYPRWAKRPKTAAWLSALSAVWDDLADRFAAGITARLAATCPADALDLVAAGMRLARAHGESDAAFREYLKDPMGRWRKAGTPEGLLAELAHLGYPSASLISWRDLYDAGFTAAFGGFTSYLFVAIDQPNGFLPPGAWDDGALWDGGTTWDATLPYPDAARDLIRVCREWKPGGMSVRFAKIKCTDGRVITLPIGDAWEWDAAGNANDFYLSGY